MNLKINTNQCVCWLFFLGITIILAKRTFFTALDDYSYYDYFQYNLSAMYPNWWDYLLSEPLWLLYTSVLGTIFDPVLAIRITIFISAWIFLTSCKKLTYGAWLFVFLAFFLDNTIASQMYFNQIRQGFALAIFLMIYSRGVSPILAAIIASCIHSSFICVLPCLVLAKMNRISLGWALVMVVVAVICIKSVMAQVYFGRRNDYLFTTNLNIVGYLYQILPNVMVLSLLKDNNRNDQERFWYRFTCLFFVFFILLSFFNEAAGRLGYFQQVFVMILIGRNWDRKWGRLCAYAWIGVLILTIILEFHRLGMEDSWVQRWGLILNGA